MSARRPRVESVTSFKRRTSRMLADLKATGEPILLTYKGRPKIVVQEAAAYQRLVAAAARAERRETIAAIRQGLTDVEMGRTKPAIKAMHDIARKFGIRSR